MFRTAAPLCGELLARRVAPVLDEHAGTLEALRWASDAAFSEVMPAVAIGRRPPLFLVIPAPPTLAVTVRPYLSQGTEWADDEWRLEPGLVELAIESINGVGVGYRRPMLDLELFPGGWRITYAGRGDVASLRLALAAVALRLDSQIESTIAIA